MKDHPSNEHLLKDSIEAEICRQEINPLLDVIRSHYESQENDESLQILDQWSEDFDVEADIIADVSAFLKRANFPTTALDDVITRNQMPHRTLTLLFSRQRRMSTRRKMFLLEMRRRKALLPL